MRQEETQVAKNILDLTDTMDEGFNYITEKLENENIKETVSMLLDVIKAFASIERALEQVLVQLKENNIPEKTNKLRDALDSIVNEYEVNKGKNAIKIMQVNLAPTFESWKDELERVLRPYIVS
ncbi:MAG: hypothetical protein JJT76_10490 [Clostridiaceae bacterium]|nr:hypothetical protein [Clostridiaceae bacterium]